MITTADRGASLRSDPARARRLNRIRWWPVDLGWLAAVAMTVRIVAAERISFQVDEQFSLLGAEMVAERGIPVLPSGMVYLHGATLSYLLAPLLAIGQGGLDDLMPLRIVVAISGAVAVALCYGLATDLTGSRFVAILSSFILALDPLSVQWSAHVRMYAPLQALTLALTWIFARMLRDGSTGRRAVGLVAVFWLAAFTHIAAILLLGALCIVALAACGRSLLGSARTMTLALAGCAIAPVVIVGLNGAGPDDQGAAETGSRASFIGDHLLRLDRVREPDLTLWRSLFRPGDLRDVMPVLVAIASGLLLGRLLDRPGLDRGARLAWWTLLAVYWITVATAVAFTIEPQPRYLLFVHPLGLLVLVVALREIGRQPRIGRLAAGLLALLIVIHPLTGLRERYEQPVVDPDYPAAIAYVATRAAASDPVVLALPAVGYLGLPNREAALFLAGPEGGSRVERYTIENEQGGVTDRWIGIPAISSTGELCQLLKEQPEAWLVIDDVRMRASWAYGGPMGDVLAGATRAVFEGDGGVRVTRPRPPERWSAAARKACRGSSS